MSGNVIEGAPTVGIAAGYGPSLREVVITDNVVRQAGMAIVVSVPEGAGDGLIVNNPIAEARAGAIVRMASTKRITGDLTKGGDGRYAQLAIGSNRVR